MCANCVAQASVYVGASLGALRMMGARARGRRGAGRTSTRRPPTTDAPVTGHGADVPPGPVGCGAAGVPRTADGATAEPAPTPA